MIAHLTKLITLSKWPKYGSSHTSSGIVKWLHENTPENVVCQVKSIDILLSDLTVVLGKPYLYLHKGGCEHLVVFSSIR